MGSPDGSIHKLLPMMRVQETFDEAVRENIVEFDMEVSVLEKHMDRRRFR